MQELTLSLAREANVAVPRVLASMPKPTVCDDVCTRILSHVERVRAGHDEPTPLAILQSNTMMGGENGVHWVTVAYSIERDDSVDAQCLSASDDDMEP